MDSIASKRNSHNRTLGMAGEDLAARELERRGLEIIDRNWRCREGEVDIVARTPAGTIGFVEVKTRATHRCGTPAEQITARKLARMRRVAGAWLGAHREVTGTSIRLDLMGVDWDGIGTPTLDYREAIQ